MMEKAGLQNPRCLPETVDLTPEGAFDDVVAFATRIGPAARIMAEWSGTEADGAAIESAVKTAFAAFHTDQGLCIPCGIQFYCAGA